MKEDGKRERKKGVQNGKQNKEYVIGNVMKKIRL